MVTVFNAKERERIDHGVHNSWRAGAQRRRAPTGGHIEIEVAVDILDDVTPLGCHDEWIRVVSMPRVGHPGQAVQHRPAGRAGGRNADVGNLRLGAHERSPSSAPEARAASIASSTRPAALS